MRPPVVDPKIEEGFVSRKNLVLDQQMFGRVDQERSGIAAQTKATNNATGLIRLSGELLVSVVQSPNLWNRYHAPLFRRFHCPGSGPSFA
jgi:hypothetical protein